MGISPTLDKTVLGVSSDEIDDRHLLASLLLEAIDQSDVDIDIEVYEGNRHPDWDRDSPCPECGSEKISIIEADDSIYTWDEGKRELTYDGVGHCAGTQISFFCQGCDQVLAEHPAAGIIDWV